METEVEGVSQGPGFESQEERQAFLLPLVCRLDTCTLSCRGTTQHVPEPGKGHFPGMLCLRDGLSPSFKPDVHLEVQL